jgi:hypothetical protein
MSDILTTYSFLPWMRQGIANQITAADLDANVKLRADINIELLLTGKGGEGGLLESPLNRSVMLYGPGDVIGLEGQAIIRAEPRNWITNYEPNYLPYIDFYDEDLPWRHTPAAPDGHRLRPWMMLVVLKEDEFEEGKNLINRPLPFIKVGDVGVFPPAEELWAWAHVHVNRSLSEAIVAPNLEAALNTFRQTLASNPDLAYSRIVSPRKLEPQMQYHAFLMPVFESGRLAGLGHNPDAILAQDENAFFATQSAWDGDGGKPDAGLYPIYHRWFFRTGTKGDFEYLVRLLTPKPANSKVGRRDVDVQHPGTNIPGILDSESPQVPTLHGVLRLGGALRVPEINFTPQEQADANTYENWDTPYPRAFQSQLAAFINLASDYQAQAPAEAHLNPVLPQKIQDDRALDTDPDPLITAPLYGRWHALTERLLKEQDGSDVEQNGNWIHELNLDPRHRLAAGFGTKIIQKNQETYMEAAWEQVGEVLAANRKIRLTQLAHMVSHIWYARHLAPTANRSQFQGQFLYLTSPIQRRVLSEGMTVAHQVKQSLVPPVAFDPRMRTIMKPRGRFARLLPFTPSRRPDALITRINEGEVTPAPPKAPPEQVATPDQVADNSRPKRVPPFLFTWLIKRPWIRFLSLGLGLLILIGVVILAAITGLNVSTITLGRGSLIGLLLLIAFWLITFGHRWLMGITRQVKAVEAVSEDHLRPETVDEMPRSPNFELSLPGMTVNIHHGARDSVTAQRYKAGLKDAFRLIAASAEAAAVPPRRPLALGTLAADIFATLDPGLTFPKRLFGTVFLPQRIYDLIGTFEIFKEAMAYPEIDTPMYKPLVDLSKEMFLPNLNLIENNSITLLETNQAFIEAYMVGLNHEFARELLWREYPTDQRGSYFRQFWDVSSFLNRDNQDDDALRERLKDIPELHLWSRFSKLGDHDHREIGGDKEEEVVLVIRGELLKKYPNAVIYAHRADWVLEAGGDIDLDRERQLVPLTPSEADNPPTTKVKTPIYEAKVDPDIYFFGFDLNAEEANGAKGREPDAKDRPGWFFVIKERPGEPRFGLDLDVSPVKHTWNDLAWEDVLGGAPDGAFIQPLSPPSVNFQDPTGTTEDEKRTQHLDDVQVQWNGSVSSSEMAYILYQVPVMVAIHASEMLPR